MAAKPAHLVELGSFLKKRRSLLTPQQVGLPPRDTTLRRVPGLRREEVAELAAISQDYYTRIEQGRLAPSKPVLDSLIRVLQLDADGTEYARSLVDQDDRAPVRSTPAGEVRPQLQRLVDQMTATPAFVFGRFLDILAWNPLVAALLVDIGTIPPAERNYVRLVFLDPRMRTVYKDWREVAVNAVAVLRMEAAQHPADPRLAALVAELSEADDDFRLLWAQQVVKLALLAARSASAAQRAEGA
ncbi:MAG: helix-turn-helix transcriptional regulator [Gordonia sp. (in: high G+C Gram-positive bacteria)]|uniref:helix-turn-helix domain-containing protein n=1 Tax=Gordonia sp. (in: high G+C Gram-positive bacteria) TaxID=84139 RepID=UPI0039E300CB